MMSIASSSWDLVFWERCGRVYGAIHGPELAASLAPVPGDAVFFGISFAVGTSMPHLPVDRIVNGTVEIPNATHRTFWLSGSAWRRPDYDNAEEFVQRMVRERVLVADPVVAAVLRGTLPSV